MKKRWLKNVGAVYLAVGMILIPTAQAAMAQEFDTGVELTEETTTELVESTEETTTELVESTEETTTELVESTEKTTTELVESTEETTTELVESTEKTATELVESTEETTTELIESTEMYESAEESETFVETKEAVSVYDGAEEETELATAEKVEIETQEEVVNNASATYESNGYKYTIYNGKANLVKYVGNEKNVVIPTELNGYPVTKLTSEVFMNNSSIESVVIPASITEYALTGLNMFVNCKSLKYVKIESSADIVECMFDRCTSLETVEITGAPTKIESYAFQGTKMKSFQIPSSVKEIDAYAFYGSDIENITIPASVVTIQGAVFEDCTMLKKVKYETSADIGVKLFSGCSSLEAIEITGKIKNIYSEAFEYSGLKEFVIPSSVTYLGEYSFALTKLEHITIPSTVKSYGCNVFSNCENLVSARIESDADISGAMFACCYKLSKLEVIGKPTAIRSLAFYKTQLENAVIPSSVTIIEDGNPFKNSSNNSQNQDGFLYQVINGVAVIVGYEGNKSDVTIPSTLGGYPVNQINSMNGASLIKNLVVPKTITNYGKNAFSMCTALESVKIESSADIPDYLFAGCRSIKNVEFTGQPSSIGEAAFYGADLKEIVIPSSVQKIGFAAFTICDTSGNFLYTIENGEAVLLDYYGTKTEVVLPVKVDGCALTAIASESTDSYQSIERLTIPASIKEYRYNTYGIFADRKNLKYVKIESSADIAGSLFYGCESLETVEITGKPTSIEPRAFEMTALKKFDIPISVTHLGYSAFARCKLENIVIPSVIQQLDFGTFEDCRNLLSVTIGCKNCDNIGVAFAGCYNLKRIEFLPSVEIINPVGFYPSKFENLCGRGITLYVTEGTPAVEFAKDCLKWGFNYVIIGKNQTGLVDMGDNVWYYKINGLTQWNYTGLVKHYGTWYYVEKGVLNWKYTGLTQYYGTWYYVEKGVLNWKYTGLTQYYGTWYYVEKGVLNWKYTGLAKNNGEWYYIENGILNWKYTGLTNYYGTWYHVQKGYLNWSYTGMTNYYGTWYYVDKGAVNWKYTGYVTYEGVRYFVKNGVGIIK